MPRISALFWESKKSVAQQEVDFSLGDFTLKGSAPEVSSFDGPLELMTTYLSVYSL
jgi:hypothetical protein